MATPQRLRRSLSRGWCPFRLGPSGRGDQYHSCRDLGNLRSNVFFVSCQLLPRSISSCLPLSHHTNTYTPTTRTPTHPRHEHLHSHHTNTKIPTARTPTHPSHEHLHTHHTNTYTPTTRTPTHPPHEHLHTHHMNTSQHYRMSILLI